MGPSRPHIADVRIPRWSSQKCALSAIVLCIHGNAHLTGQLLFLDTELAESLDPRVDRTSAVRSQLLNVLKDHLQGIAAHPLNASPKPQTGALPNTGSPANG